MAVKLSQTLMNGFLVAWPVIENEANGRRKCLYISAQRLEKVLLKGIVNNKRYWFKLWIWIM